ncbi:MAG: nicotinate (nicotinamide) nucleotide adenylyltransferase [Clostridia bacterium]|nr:nicotinate (nicotinamide) nucleotide adenylyltransferase [Clostridia bacterium]
MSVTAIFGGTFNPFHIGHYEMLAAINDLSFVDEIFVMPDKIPPHKICDFLASDKDRIEMCKIACKDFNKAKLCLIEFERDGKSYTYDTVCALKEKYPDKEFYLVCGGDMITSFKTWYNWDVLLKEVGILAFYRVGEGEKFDTEIASLKNLGGKITLVNKDITEVSSTELRKNIESDKNTKLIPKDILTYINEKGLYY